MVDNGYVYVLMNPSMQNLVKIGKTVREPEERAKELSSTTGVPTPFIVVYNCYFKSCTEAEIFVHTFLESKGFRVSTKREFFEIPIKDAIDAVMNAKEHFGEFKKNNLKNLEEFEENFEDETDDYDPDYDNEEIREALDKARKYEIGFDDELQDIDEAIKYFLKAIKLGSIEACQSLAYIYQSGNEVKEDKDKAMKYFKEGAKRGDISCYASLAPLYLELENEDNAYKCWQKYFTLSEHINYMDGVNYLKFIATYPRNIEFIDRLKTLGAEVFDGLYKYDYIMLKGELCKLNPDFIEYARGVINKEINQDDTNLTTL
ncbi:MAG: GIY-YIG nuclease family protein [Candidatus Muirbacterium halophilum]|nr:GIY-YIG nuclease family protein [Candidatus Muirbacterium halophilum]